MKKKDAHSVRGAQAAPHDRAIFPGAATDKNGSGKLSLNGLFAEDGLPSRGLARTNLRPISDQLIALAEQLRQEALQSESRLDCDRSALSGNLVRIAGEDGSFGPLTPIDRSHASRRMARDGACPEKAVRLREFYARLARAHYEQRRRRNSVFGNAELFGEPAWDILLDLYVAHAKGEPVSVSSACIGSAAPPTTGLRWLGVLAEQGLTLREHDPNDQRRVLVRLTERGLDAMDAYFATIAGDIPTAENGAG